MLNRFRKGKTPIGEMIHNSELWKRIGIGQFMKKRGMTGTNQFMKYARDNFGYHGILGELEEEIWNYPLSNLNEGNDEFNEKSVVERA